MISISAGHWAIGTGARGLIDEVTEARKVAKRIAQIIQLSNVTVHYIEDNSSNNQRENLNFLVTQHNKTQRKLDVSVHFNASGDTQIKGMGTEVLYFYEKELASKVSSAISGTSGLINRGAKQRKDLAFLSNTNVPAILLEICFVNSTVDVAIYRRDFEKICQSVASVLLGHLGKSPPSTESVKDVKPMEFLNPVGRLELQQLLKKARDAKVIASTHTDEKINKYTDVELLSYSSAVFNRTFNK